MKYQHLQIALILLGVWIGALPVSAVGGGGGGSQPTCDSDVWVCTDWSVCSSQGFQTRSCTMTFDCTGDNVVTARPEENRSCTPPAPPPEPKASPQPEAGTAPVADPPPPPAGTPVPPPQAAPVPPPPPRPTCTADVWNCDEWRACDPEGNQLRRCVKTVDCPAAETPPPRFVKPCEMLQCGNLTMIYDRVLCRMNLAPAGIARELQIEYLPEPCRPETGEARDACIARYRSYQPCWRAPDDAGRFACARAVLGLGGTLTPAQRDKVFAMIIFRLYNLEKRAEDFTYRGADIARVAEFVTFIQKKKIAFYEARSKAERRQIILDVRAEWKRFYNDIKNQLE